MHSIVSSCLLVAFSTVSDWSCTHTIDMNIRTNTEHEATLSQVYVHDNLLSHLETSLICLVRSIGLHYLLSNRAMNVCTCRFLPVFDMCGVNIRCVQTFRPIRMITTQCCLHFTPYKRTTMHKLIVNPNTRAHKHTQRSSERIQSANIAVSQN